MTARGAALAAIALACALAAPARAYARQGAPAAQQGNAAERLKSQKDELEKIRLERADLQRRMHDLQSTVHDLSEERTNIERQAEATARVVHTLDRQLGALADEENEATANLIRAQDELAIKRAVERIGLGRADVESIFYSNAKRFLRI